MQRQDNETYPIRVKKGKKMGEKSENSLGGLWDNIRMTNIHITDV